MFTRGTRFWPTAIWLVIFQSLLVGDLRRWSRCGSTPIRSGTIWNSQPRGNENPISTEVFKGKPIYQWGISHCHIWLPEGRWNPRMTKSEICLAVSSLFPKIMDLHPSMFHVGAQGLNGKAPLSSDSQIRSHLVRLLCPDSQWQQSGRKGFGFVSRAGSFPFLWQHARFQVLELLLDPSAPSKCHPRGNENPISTEVFNGKPIYQWGISHCHIWLPEGRIGHPLVPGNSEEKLPWLNWTDLMIALQARWTLQTLTVPWLHHCEIVTFAAIILIYIYIKYINLY